MMDAVASLTAAVGDVAASEAVETSVDVVVVGPDPVVLGGWPSPGLAGLAAPDLSRCQPS